MTTELHTKETARKRAVNTLRELANRIESGEGMSNANISTGLLYEEDQKYSYSTKITDSVYINRPKPIGYLIAINVAFPKKNDNAE